MLLTHSLPDKDINIDNINIKNIIIIMLIINQYLLKYNKQCLQKWECKNTIYSLK